MDILIERDADAVAEVAAGRIAALVRARADAVIGVATGSSPLGTYAALAQLVEGGSLSFAGASAFALDEYVGIDQQHPESYHSVIRRTVTEPLGFDPMRVHVPNGAAPDLAAACEEYEDAISHAGGVDLQLLGIGSNGHIGFNEPSSSFGSRTRVKTLAPATREANARFFDSLDEVPVHCLTQGLGTILDARTLLLVATGEGKAEAVSKMIEGPVSSMCPASALQLHPNAIVVIDDLAASRLELRDYYEHVQQNQPQ